MTIFGITGGSGSGKTLASSMFAELGVEVIDADAISREVTNKGSKCLNELVKYFGNEILQTDGTLNRRHLASIAFSDVEKTKMLNTITHKYIKDKVSDIIANSTAELAAIDGAVIIGSIFEQDCEFIVSVIADRDIRAERIKERDKLTDFQVAQRLDAQPNEEFYRSHSRYIIQNNGTEQELKKQVADVYSRIKEV